MTVLTIHALDEATERRVRAKAQKEHKSLNQTVKELLAQSVDTTSPPHCDRKKLFAEFFGIWSDADWREFTAATTELETILQADWQ